MSHADVSVGAREIAQAMRADLFAIDCEFYLAGPADFVTTLFDELRLAGVPTAQIFKEVL